MQPYDSSRLSPPITFNLTIIDERVLLVRLTIELHRALKELRPAFDDLRDNPRKFLRGLSLETWAVVRRQLTVTNILGFTSAILLVVFAGVLITAIDRTKTTRGYQPLDDEDSLDGPEIIVLTPLNDGRSTIYPPSIGRVGLRSGAGEGSSPTPAHAQGGGSGGFRDLAPAQIGKVPQPSEIPSVIPKEPPLNPPSLPTAGVDLDP